MSIIERFSNIGKVLGVVTAMIGIVTFIVKSVSDYQLSLDRDRRDEEVSKLVRAADAREWSKLKIYQILLSEGPISHKDLYARFQSEGLPIPAIDREFLSQDNFSRAMFELSVSGFVYLNKDGMYAMRKNEDVQATVDLAALADARNAEERLNRRIAVALAEKINNPKQMYALEDLAALVASSLEIDQKAVDLWLREDLAAGRLQLDSKGRLFNPGSSMVGEFISNVLRREPGRYTAQEIADMGAKELGFDAGAFSARIELALNLGRLIKNSSGKLSIRDDTNAEGVAP